ncbi:MAG: branched-chain amino acid ABC transporter permease [Paenibacillaceae bacterium]
MNSLIPLISGAMVLALPIVLSTYGIKLASEVFIMSIFALSLGLIVGYAGLVSLGHAAFFGIGAYTVAILGEHMTNTYLLLAAAIVFSGLIAWITGILFFRSSGAYFLMITLAFSQMVFAVFYKMKSVTGGSDGMTVNVEPDLGFGVISGSLHVYYLMAIAFLLCYLLLYLFVQSPAGKVVRGVKENESRMKALGYNTHSYKLLAYTLSGMMAGFAGGLYAYYNFFVSPDITNWMFSGQALVMVIIGGVGTLFGPPIGAAVLIVLQNYMSSYTERWPIIMGIIFIALVLYGRGGIAHLLINVWKKIFMNKLPIMGKPRQTL